MTPEERAKELGMRIHAGRQTIGEMIGLMTAAITAAVKAEREECAKVADGRMVVRAADVWEAGHNVACYVIAAAIRERAP